jgi:hypothetical protein
MTVESSAKAFRQNKIEALETKKTFALIDSFYRLVHVGAFVG